MKPFIKVVNPGMIEIGGRSREVFVEIVYTDDGELTLHGVVGPWHSGNCAGSCGQIDGELKDINRFHKNWSREKVRELRKVWKERHLNHLHADCIHQADDPDFCRLSQEGKLKAPPCPVCGWTWGRSWAKREVPEDVLEFLLRDLPDSRKIPAWV